MSTFPAITGAQIRKALFRLGFDLIRVKGSHHFLRHPDGRCTVVPIHRGELLDDFFEEGSTNRVLRRKARAQELGRE